jgi:hypothetical protein
MSISGEHINIAQEIGWIFSAILSLCQIVSSIQVIIHKTLTQDMHISECSLMIHYITNGELN